MFLTSLFLCCLISRLAGVLAGLRELQEALASVQPLWADDDESNDEIKGMIHGNYALATNASSSICSEVRELCGTMGMGDEKYRLGCCKPLGAKYMRNIKLSKGGKLETMYANSNACSSQLLQDQVLPPVQSVMMRHTTNFQLRVVKGSSSSSSSGINTCKRYINGTLHVMGKQSTYNLFHAMNDNVLPLMAQIVIDAHYFSEYLALPRYLLTGFQPAGDAVPHYQLLRDALDGEMTLSEAEDVCFDRIIWGFGARVIYNHALVALRRKAADLTRALAIAKYNPPLPIAFASPFEIKANSSTSVLPSSTSAAATTTTRLERNGKALRVVVFSRGDTGSGRSIAGESLLKQGLINAGAQVVICSDYKGMSFTEQLGYAVHADVVMGLHGAGLMNGVFSARGSFIVELKTLYGYTLDLFALVADSRQGTHVQINLKMYAKQGGNLPIDQPLVRRVVDGLARAVNVSSSSSSSSSKVNPFIDANRDVIRLAHEGDLIFVTHGHHLGLGDHLLGPLTSSLSATCSNKLLNFFQLWTLIGADPKAHCLPCGKS